MREVDMHPDEDGASDAHRHGHSHGHRYGQYDLKWLSFRDLWRAIFRLDCCVSIAAATVYLCQAASYAGWPPV